MRSYQQLAFLFCAYALTSCATTDTNTILIGNWDATSSISKAQGHILYQKKSQSTQQKEPTKTPEYTVAIHGEYVFSADGSFTSTSQIRLNFSIVIGTAFLSYQLDEKGSWKLVGNTITLVADSSTAKPADQVTRLFNITNPGVALLLQSPPEGRNAKIVSIKKESMRLEFDPEAKVVIDFTRRQ